MKYHQTLPEGFSDRPVTMDDIDNVLEMINFCSEKIIGGTEINKDTLKNEWKTPGFNQATDQRVVISPEGKLAAIMEVWTLRKPPIHPWVWGRVHPKYEGLGLGTFLLQWAESRAEKVINEVPAEARVAFRSSCWAIHQPSNDLLTGYGMDLIRQSYQMRIDLNGAPPAAIWPEGFTIRTFRPEDAEAVYQADNEAFQDHFGHVEEEYDTGLERFKHFHIDYPEFDPELWFLAYDGQELAGICLCRKNSWEDDQMGWVSILGVRRPWRKRGLGLALLQHSFGAFWQRGKQKVGLGVDAQNLTGALRLYEKAGMHVHRQQNMYEKEIRPGIELSKTG